MSPTEKPKLYIGLLHYPVYNKNMEVISTSVTNLDIHDIARISCTYDVCRYYVIHPMETQRNLVQDVLDYWQVGYGSQYNQDRQTAFARVALTASLEETVSAITEETGTVPALVTTDARVYPNTVSYLEMRDKFADGRPFLLLFGTGWGIERQTMMKSDFVLEPVYGPGEYNHLSVRSAVAIILDRLLGETWWERK